MEKQHTAKARPSFLSRGLPRNVIMLIQDWLKNVKCTGNTAGNVDPHWSRRMVRYLWNLFHRCTTFGLLHFSLSLSLSFLLRYIFFPLLLRLLLNLLLRYFFFSSIILPSRYRSGQEVVGCRLAAANLAKSRIHT